MQNDGKKRIKKMAEGTLQNSSQSGSDINDISPRRSRSEIRGAARCPLMGEDAQQWVSRTRQEDNGGLAE